jgi:lysozyme
LDNQSAAAFSFCQMKTSEYGLKQIKRREGVVLHVYRDSKRLPTAGVGHLLTQEENQHLPVGAPITQAQSDTWLKEDLGECETCINTVVKPRLKQNEFDALVSLAFNIGVAGFKRSTVVRRLNAGDKAGAASAILLWNKPPEIQGRRRTEYNQFRTPYTVSTAAAATQSSDELDKHNENTLKDSAATVQQPPNNADPSTEQNVAVVKEEHLGFWATLKNKIVTAFTGVGGATGVTSYAQQAQTFGLSSLFWERIFYIALIALLGWIVIEIVRYFYTVWTKRKRTDALVAANSSSTNNVNIIKPEQIAEYQAAGWVVIQRA